MSGTSTLWAGSITPGTTFSSTTLAIATVSLAPAPYSSTDETSTSTTRSSSSVFETHTTTDTFSRPGSSASISFLTETDTEAVESASPSEPFGKTSTTTRTSSTFTTIVISNGGTSSTTITAEESQHGPTWTQSPVPYGTLPTMETTAGVLSVPTTVNNPTDSTSTEFITSTEMLSSVISQPPFANISGATTPTSWSYSNKSTSTKIPWRSFTSTLIDSSISEATVSSPTSSTGMSISALATTTGQIDVTSSPSSSEFTTPASSSATASQTSSTPSTSCGPTGNFVVNFDDLPSGPVPTDGTNTTDPLDSEDEPTIFSPFHDLFFSNGFYYVPPPSDPYQPSSPPQLAVFLPNKTGQPLDHPDIGTLYTGEVGAGPASSSSAFAFNAYSARLGCDWRGPSGCTMHIFGYRFDVATGNQTQVAHQMAMLPPCASGSGCELALTTLTAEFANVTGIRFEAEGGSGEALKWFMDDLALGWANNTCAAAGERANVRTASG
ncbi:MAG: hypothetical protein Q9157_001218 [Trypethelium eluteriae]